MFIDNKSGEEISLEELRTRILAAPIDEDQIKNLIDSVTNAAIRAAKMVESVKPPSTGEFWNEEITIEELTMFINPKTGEKMSSEEMKLYLRNCSVDESAIQELTQSLLAAKEELKETKMKNQPSYDVMETVFYVPDVPTNWDKINHKWEAIHCLTMLQNKYEVSEYSQTCLWEPIECCIEYDKELEPAVLGWLRGYFSAKYSVKMPNDLMKAGEIADFMYDKKMVIERKDI